ncbi:MAG: ABC transporter substrate-binding protein [Pseudohongiellaceae bacterium]
MTVTSLRLFQLRFCSFLLIITALVLGACSSEDSASNGQVVRIPLGAGGVGFLPLHIMREQNLIEKHAAELGLDSLAVQWIDLGGPSAMNDALLSRSVDFIAAGPPAFLTLWDRTRNSLAVKGVAAISALPMYLNTRSETFSSLDDISDNDKIALTAIKVSIPAIAMQMYAAERYGVAEAERFDRYTVSMAHPDGVVTMLSGSDDITAHFTSPPFHQREIQDPEIRTIMTTDEVMGGATTFTMLSTTSAFHAENPEIIAAVIAALEEAQQFILDDPESAADVLIRVQGNAGLAQDEIAALLQDPDIHFSTTPQNVKRYADFMYSIGTLEQQADSWRDFFIDEIAQLPGS